MNKFIFTSFDRYFGECSTFKLFESTEQLSNDFMKKTICKEFDLTEEEFDESIKNNPLKSSCDNICQDCQEMSYLLTQVK